MAFKITECQSDTAEGSITSWYRSPGTCPVNARRFRLEAEEEDDHCHKTFAFGDHCAQPREKEEKEMCSQHIPGLQALIIVRPAGQEAGERRRNAYQHRLGTSPSNTTHVFATSQRWESRFLLKRWSARYSVHAFCQRSPVPVQTCILKKLQRFPDALGQNREPASNSFRRLQSHHSSSSASINNIRGRCTRRLSRADEVCTETGRLKFARLAGSGVQGALEIPAQDFDKTICKFPGKEKNGHYIEWEAKWQPI